MALSSGYTVSRKNCDFKYIAIQTLETQKIHIVPQRTLSLKEALNSTEL